MKPKIYAVTNNKYARPFLRSPVFALLTHWVFQCMLHMDRTELAFKLGLDAILTALFGVIISRWLPLPAGILAGFLLAHTLNFLFNGQLFVVLKAFALVSHTAAEYQDFIQGLQQRLQNEPSLQWAAVFGSLSRGALHASSDLDIRLLRRPGWIPAFRACWFVLCERSRAVWAHFPLDILVLDSPRLLENIRKDEPAIVLLNRSIQQPPEVRDVEFSQPEQNVVKPD